jgi:fucose permease
MTPPMGTGREMPDGSARRRGGAGPWWLLLLAYLGFVSTGLDNGMHGVAWPYTRTDLGVPISAVGYILLTATTGSVLSSIAAGFAMQRLGVGRLLAVSTAVTSTALAGYALAPSLPFAVAATLFLGAGGGAIDAGLNAHVARRYSARHLTWLHASFGVGATIGPLVMIGVIAAGLTWRSGYATVAVIQALLALAFTSTARAWTNPPTKQLTAPKPPAGRQTWALPGLWLGAAAFVVEVGIEMGAAVWGFLLLTEGRGMAAPVAGMAVSAYWASMIVGRLLSGAVADRIAVHRILPAGITGIAAGATLMTLPAPSWLAAAGLILTGFAAAPMFPLLTMTTTERVGAAHADRAIGVQSGFSSLGAATLPAGIGVLIGHVGPTILGPSLLILAAVLGMIYIRSRQPTTSHP